MIEKLAINVNGCDKYATGLNKTTTIDDIKYAMLTATSQQSGELCMDDFGVFEQWQGNERLLDGRVKIYKLIRVWQSLPGDQLSQVQFLIKRKRANMTAANRHHHHHQQQQQKPIVSSSNSKPASFALCTLSPAMRKTWNYEKMARKSSYVNRQLRLVATGETNHNDVSTTTTTATSTCDESSSSSCDEESQVVEATRRRYASIKRYHRSKRSSIKKCSGGQIRSAYVDLVGKQTEIIEKQLAELAAQSATSKNPTKQTEEETTKRLFDDYLNVEMCLEAKLAKIEQLTREFNSLVKDKHVVATNDVTSSSSSSVAKVAKVNRRLAASMEVDRKQCDKLKSMDTALERIDDIITLKQKSVESLENELKRLEEFTLNSVQPVDAVDGNENDEEEAIAAEMVMTTASSRLPNHHHHHNHHRFAKSSSTSSTTSSNSAQSSTSSLFTSISSINSQSSLHNVANLSAAVANTSSNINNKSCQSYVGDNESDTGISSANSEDFSTQQLETLV